MKHMDFRPRLLENDDPFFFGVLALWSALGFVMLLWVWNTEVPVYELDEIPDRFTEMVMEVDKPDKPEEDIDLETDAEADLTAEKKEEKAKVEKVEPKTKAEKAQRQEDARKEVLQQSKLLLKFIGTRGESGSVVANMWSDEDQGLADLDGILDEVGGVEIAGADALRTGEGVEGTASDIGALKGSEGGTVGLGDAPAVMAKPRVDAGSGNMEIEGDKAGVSAVVKRYAGQLRYCYEKQLNSAPDLQGRVEIGWEVYDGSVEGVYVVSNSTGNAALAECIMQKIRKWSFDDSVQGDIVWPFGFRTKD
jgi:hypothetical protein